MSDFTNNLKRILEKYDPEPLGDQRLFSVLLPLIQLNDAWHILYEVRSEHISQPGEVSFPGGRVEANESIAEAAIRETMEELNIRREDISLLGEMDFVVSDTTIIHCFVGVLENVDPSILDVNKAEVEKVFTLPLSWLSAHPPMYHTLAIEPRYGEHFPTSRLPGGESYQWSRRKHIVGFYDLPEGGYNLWGFTARLTDRFVRFAEENALLTSTNNRT